MIGKESIPQPFQEKLGIHSIEAELTEVLEYFDWSPFFWSWELKGKYPDIFEKERVGAEAKDLFDNAQKLLNKIIDEDLFKCEAMVGIWPAHTVGDDVDIFDDLDKSKKLDTFHFLRRQQSIPNKPLTSVYLTSLHQESAAK